MIINGVDVPVNVRRELEEYEWHDAIWTESKLISRSPFRDDRTPSFYVWLLDDSAHNTKAGYWGDSGGVGKFEKGGFLRLLSFLRNESEEEVAEYLIEKYAPNITKDYDNFMVDLSDLRVDLGVKKRKAKTLDTTILNQYSQYHSYLENRGISRRVQKALKVGYSRKYNAVTIPWFDALGRLANIKYRKVDSKQFWYVKGGRPIRELLYGIDIIHRKRCEEAAIVEAEIDAMTVMNAGFPALAVGGSKFSDEKRDLILRSQIKRLYIAVDNDLAGKKLRREIHQKLEGYVDIFYVCFPSRFKDVNDIEDKLEINNYIKNAVKMNGLEIFEYGKRSWASGR